MKVLVQIITVIILILMVFFWIGADRHNYYWVQLITLFLLVFYFINFRLDLLKVFKQKKEYQLSLSHGFASLIVITIGLVQKFNSINFPLEWWSGILLSIELFLGFVNFGFRIKKRELGINK